MTQQEFREFVEAQIEFYKREIQFSNDEIECLTREIKRDREEDLEQCQFAWSKGILTETEKKIWGDPKSYKSEKTRKDINRRRAEYRWRKKFEAHLHQYETELVEMTK